MTTRRTLKDFLSNNRISNGAWKDSKIEWSELEAIANDHEANRALLLQSAELFAKIIQSFEHVHSVRWRVKNTDHLLEKIVRKRSENSETYMSIDRSNYFQIVTDLVGVRALHLFKDECISIDTALRGKWEPIEDPVVYIRSGDPESLNKEFRDRNFEIKNHPAGYRSVHYVFASQAVKQRVIAEVQVRTIFEEGWSEIDHRVRYPNFSTNTQVSYFLTIFNRLAGSADEMGDFVRGLASTIQDLESQAAKADREKLQTLESMETLIRELESMKKQDRESRQKFEAIKSEFEKLKNQVARNPTTVLISDPATSFSRLFADQSIAESIKISRSATDSIASAILGFKVPELKTLPAYLSPPSAKPEDKP